jgi:hypothetical protein
MMGLPVPMREEDYHSMFNNAMNTEHIFSIFSVVGIVADFASFVAWDC